MSTIKGTHKKLKCLVCDKLFLTTLEIRTCADCKISRGLIEENTAIGNARQSPVRNWHHDDMGIFEKKKMK